MKCPHCNKDMAYDNVLMMFQCFKCNYKYDKGECYESTT